MIGICKFCEKESEIKRSHAIGNTVFRKILKKCEGNAAITIVRNENKIKKCNDSWAIEQLCGVCENFFNSRFEDYSIHVLRKEQKGVKVEKHPSWISFQGINQTRLILYFLSIYWRAGWSEHQAYNAVVINQGVSDYLRKCFLGEHKLNSSLFCIKVCKLVDESKGFDQESLSQIIVNPFNRILKNVTSMCMLYEGYFFEIFIRGVNFKDRKMPGYLDQSKKTLLVPYIDILDIPEVVDSFVDGLRIHNNKSGEVK